MLSKLGIRMVEEEIEYEVGWKELMWELDHQFPTNAQIEKLQEGNMKGLQDIAMSSIKHLDDTEYFNFGLNNGWVGSLTHDQGDQDF